MKALSNVSSEEAETLSKSAADLMVTLLTERCRTETQQAMKYEGSDTLKTSFSVLGQVAMQGIMTHAAVANYLGGLSKYMDQEKINKVLGVQK